MRLPWNKKYIEIAFHICVTIGVLVITGILLFKLSDAKNVIFQTAGKFLAVFSPLLFAFVFSFLLEPSTAFFQKRYEQSIGIVRKSKVANRKVGTLATYISLFLILSIGGRFLAQGIGTADLDALAQQVGEYIEKAGDLLVLLNIQLAKWGILQNVEGIISAWISEATLWIQTKILGLATALPQIGSSLIDIVIGLTVAFYFLMEKERMREFWYETSALLLGKKWTARIRTVLREVHFVFMGYLGGQLTDAGIMAVLFSVAFRFVGLPYGIVLGVISGFSNLIPYFGAIVAFILAVLSGLLSGEPIRALYASILIVILQQLDSVFIVPRVMGRKVELHPVLVLLSLAIFGRLFGFWGLFFAVPLGALLCSFFRWICRRKTGTDSEFYS